jgi:hypothetical protein
MILSYLENEFFIYFLFTIKIAILSFKNYKLEIKLFKFIENLY